MTLTKLVSHSKNSRILMTKIKNLKTSKLINNNKIFNIHKINNNSFSSCNSNKTENHPNKNKNLPPNKINNKLICHPQ